jgi:hypothetical protein
MPGRSPGPGNWKRRARRQAPCGTAESGESRSHWSSETDWSGPGPQSRPAGPGLGPAGPAGPAQPVLIPMPVRLVRRPVLGGPAGGPHAGRRSAGRPVRPVPRCGVLAHHVGQGGPHAQDQEAGHESGDPKGARGTVTEAVCVRGISRPYRRLKLRLTTLAVRSPWMGKRTARCSSSCRTGENARICAVEVGFEPTEGLPLHTLSRRAPSATRRLHRR